MSRLTRNGTAEPVSRDQILRHARGQGNIHFPDSADHEQDWQPYPVDPYNRMGGRPNGALLKKTERKVKNPLEAHRITEQPRRHGSSVRYIRDPMTQGYRPGGACRSCGMIPKKSSRNPGPFLVVSHYTIWTTVITLQTPPVTHAMDPGPARCRWTALSSRAFAQHMVNAAKFSLGQGDSSPVAIYFR